MNRSEAEPSTPRRPLECRDVRVAHGRIEVCHGIDLSVGAAELVAVLGPNGAGKSSFLCGIAGEVKASGEIRVDGRDIDGLPAHERVRAGVALVPEGRGNCFAALSVHENLLLGARTAPASERAAGLAYVLDLFPVLKRRLSQEAGTLSGGEQQMLAIAMALARRPTVLLLDEPSQGLAPTVLRDLVGIFRALRELRVGMVVAEQNEAFAGEIADRFVVLVGGRVVASGERGELSRDQLAAAYLSTGDADPRQTDGQVVASQRDLGGRR